MVNFAPEQLITSVSYDFIVTIIEKLLQVLVLVIKHSQEVKVIIPESGGEFITALFHVY